VRDRLEKRNRVRKGDRNRCDTLVVL